MEYRANNLEQHQHLMSLDTCVRECYDSSTTYSSGRFASFDLLRGALQPYCNLSHSCRKHGGLDLSCSDRAGLPGSQSPNHKRHKSNVCENVPNDSRSLHRMRKIDCSGGTMHGG